MATTSYYYIIDDDGAEHTVSEPGELCDFCGDLATISKKGSLIKVSSPDPLQEEYGHSGDLHAHEECLRAAIKVYETLLNVWKADLERRQEGCSGENFDSTAHYSC